MSDGFIWDGSKEGLELARVEVVVSADTAAQIETKWIHSSDGFGDVDRIKTTGKKERDANGVADTTAQCPIVSAPSAAKLFNVQIQIAGVEQQGVHMCRRGDRIIHRCSVGHMDDLNQRDTGQLVTKAGVNGGGQMITKLKSVRAATMLLLNDGLRRAFAGKQEGCNRRRHGGDNPRNCFLGNYAWSTGHG